MLGEQIAQFLCVAPEFFWSAVRGIGITCTLGIVSHRLQTFFAQFDGSLSIRRAARCRFSVAFSKKLSTLTSPAYVRVSHMAEVVGHTQALVFVVGGRTGLTQRENSHHGNGNDEKDPHVESKEICKGIKVMFFTKVR